MSEFAPICIYLAISPLVSLIPLGVPFPFSSKSSTYPEKLSAYECGSDPSGDARSRFDIRFYPVPILFIIPDPEVTFSFPSKLAALALPVRTELSLEFISYIGGRALDLHYPLDLNQYHNQVDNAMTAYLFREGVLFTILTILLG